jgi:hypothetical protein
MVWDDDVNWEGLFERVAWSAGPAGVRLVAAQVVMNEEEEDDDSFLFTHAAQSDFAAGGHEVELQVASYLFQNPDPLAVALELREQIRTQHTNALRRDDAGQVVGFASGFHLVDAIAQATFKTGRANYPLVASADFVVNIRAASDRDAGLWLTAEYGTASTPGTFAATYTYARIEQDAVLSAFNYSDMVPATNVVTSIGTFSYMAARRVHFDFTAIWTKLLELEPAQPNPLTTRIQIDARVSF